MTSLTAHVLLNKLTITSLGASGAIAGLVAAWCMLHSEYVKPLNPFPPGCLFLLSSSL
jgi:membrane associated rhomboid family serine protease